MNQYLKTFLHRGLMFAGFGPMVVGIVYLILSYSVAGFSLTGQAFFWAILSTYLLAFLQAGVTVFNQIESWSIAKSLFCHFGVLYLAYVACYLLNSWIPFDPKVVLIFTLIFVVGYLAVWLTVYLCVKGTSKRLNEKIK